MQPEPTGIKRFNAALENLKTGVNHLLEEKRNGIPVFYHIKTCNVGEIVNHVLSLKAATFYRKMKYLKNEKSADQSELHKEIIRFLKTKSMRDGEVELKSERDIDEHGEEFVRIYNNALEGIVKGTADKVEGSKDLNTDLELEVDTEI